MWLIDVNEIRTCSESYNIKYTITFHKNLSKDKIGPEKYKLI
jgi:hypothetical protein